MKVINLFGGPGVGKSTIGQEVFVQLKKKHCNCEWVGEFAKDLVWDESFKSLENQIYIFGVQNHRLSRLKSKIDVAITDAPFINGIIYSKVYNPLDSSNKFFHQLIHNEYLKYHNINVFIERETTYQKIGRYQDEANAKLVDAQIIKTLEEFVIPFKRVGLSDAAKRIIDML